MSAAEPSEACDAILTSLNLEGDREMDRRRDLTAAFTSTWWTCVGEGRVKVPPPLLEYAMIPLSTLCFGYRRSYQPKYLYT